MQIMIKLLLGGSNRTLINNIAAKIIARLFRKRLGLKKTRIEVNDLVIMDDGEDMVKVHINGDIQLEKETFLRLIDGKLDLPD
jgi:hypothetical protein